MVEPIETVDEAGSAQRDAAYAAMMESLGYGNGVNRTVGLYDVPGFGKATPGQFAMFVCFRQADANEQLAVSLMNLVAQRSAQIKAEAAVLQQLLTGAGTLDQRADIGDYVCLRTNESPSLGDFLIYECEIDKSLVDGGIEDFENRQKIAAKMQECLQSAMSDNELRQTDLQMTVNRVAVCMTTGSNIVSELGQSALSAASKLNR